MLEARCAALRRAFPKRDATSALMSGGVEDMLGRIADYVAIGVTRFILRRIAESDADLLRQTERLIADVIPTAQRLNPPSPA